MNVPDIDLYSYGASRALKLEGTTDDYIQTNKNTIENTDIRIFGKQTVNGSRRIYYYRNINLLKKQETHETY